MRQVKNIQASWVEQQHGQPGRFTLRLVLDNGVEEYILEPDADDIDVIPQLFGRNGHTAFDIEHRVLIFNNLAVK